MTFNINKGRQGKRFLLVVNFIFLVAFIMNNICYANANKISQNLDNQAQVKIAFITYDPPLSMRLPNGQPAGYLIEFWQLWAETVGVSIEWIGGSYEENIQAIKSGRADFQAGLFDSARRRLWADFSIPITQIRTAIYFLPEMYKGQKLSATDTPSVSVGKFSFQEQFLRKNYPNIKIHPFENARLAINELINKKVDAIVAEVPYMNANLGLLGMQGAFAISSQHFLNNTVHSMFLKSHVELKRFVDLGIRRIPLKKIQQLERKWFQDEPSYFTKLINAKVPNLNLNQLDWLKKHPSLSIGISTDLPPFEFLDQQGQYRDIGAEYIHRIEAMLGIELNPKLDLNWSQVLLAIKHGQIDSASDGSKNS
ncbi:MAG: transporter substrate-binding domain-containing protein [Enterobacterales bacterium]|nr:transporter substrate-binding domain-containing protein [Enterobacterales bacterium]